MAGADPGSAGGARRGLARPVRVGRHDPGGRRRHAGEVAGLVALDEVVLHGWDLAKGTGQAYEPDSATAALVNGFLVESRKGDVPESLFGPVVEIGADAQTFDHALGLAGRDPAWQQAP